MEEMVTMINTMMVVIIVSRRDGQEILVASCRTSFRYWNGFNFAMTYILKLGLAGAGGLEPTTCGFGDRRSTN